jgi:transmembrane sensor
VDRALAWRNGKIHLAGSSLAEAVAEFNRYNGRKLVLADQDLAGERFDGVFRTDDPEGFAKAVKESLGVPIDLGQSELRIGRRPA